MEIRVCGQVPWQAMALGMGAWGIGMDPGRKIIVVVGNQQGGRGGWKQLLGLPAASGHR